MQSAGPNPGVVLAGMVLAPEAAAPLFAALRVALLLALFPLAARMVAAFLVSRRLHQRDTKGVQRICTLATVGSSVPALIGFALFAFAGDTVMALFGADFAASGDVLTVMSAGYLIKALAGPSNLLMQLAGRERAYLRLITTSNLGGLAAVVALAAMFGAIGAAAGARVGLAAWSIWSRNDVVRHMGVGASALSILARRGG